MSYSSALKVGAREEIMKQATILTISVFALLAAPLSAQADTSDKRIALSNNYAGNSWRQAMLRSWEKVTKAAVADAL